MFRRIREWFKLFRQDGLSRYLIKNTGLTGDERLFPEIKELVDGYIDFAAGFEGLGVDDEGHFSVERIKSVYEAFGVVRSIEDLNFLSGKLKQLNKFYPGLYSLLNKIVMPLHSKHLEREEAVDELRVKVHELNNNMSGLISDYAAYRKSFGDFKSGIVELINDGAIDLTNEFKLFIYTLGNGGGRVEDLYREGLVEGEVKCLLDLTLDMDLIVMSNGFYELTRFGSELLPFCDDCERIDYHELISDNIDSWSNYLVCLEARDNVKSKNNHIFEVYNSSVNIVKKLFPDDFNLLRTLNKEWQVIKRCARLEYDGHVHSKNYRKNEISVKNILKLMQDVKEGFIEEGHLTPLT